MKNSHKILLSSLIIAAVAMLGCDDASKKADKAQQMSLLALASGSGAIGTCMSCHNGSDSMGTKYLNAKSGYEASVHGRGPSVDLWINDGGGIVEANWHVIGAESHGSNAYYTYGGGCQVCHTNEGFVKLITGGYAGRKAINDDVIADPSPPGCFTCHDPHGKFNFEPRVPNGTTILTMAGSTYAKSKGQICTNCHYARLVSSVTPNAGVAPVYVGTCREEYNAPSTGTNLGKTTYSFICSKAEDYIITLVRNATTSGRSLYAAGPHHSPATDMLQGEGGAENSSATYNNGPHTDLADANCVQCHMTTPTALRLSMSSTFGGHAFNISGNVHGTNVANPAGCQPAGCHSQTDGSRVCNTLVESTSTSNCWYVNDNTGIPQNLVTKKSGMMRDGDAILEKGADTAQYSEKLAELMAKLADPDNPTPCNGALASYYATILGTATITWSTIPNSASITDRRCAPTNASYTLPKDAAATSTTNTVKLVKAMWNYNMVREDKSKGVHNYRYAAQLLWDTLVDLNQPGFLPTTGPLVTTRP